VLVSTAGMVIGFRALSLADLALMHTWLNADPVLL
jgi:hypothetical protein